MVNGTGVKIHMLVSEKVQYMKNVTYLQKGNCFRSLDVRIILHETLMLWKQDYDHVYQNWKYLKTFCKYEVNERIFL